jgi:cyclopropane fatty-acyl-phospholipid synthase-like methyltransferase/methyltransferase-like protein
MQPQASSYDDVPYDSHALPQTQPDRLAALAGLFSLETVPPGRARVLEIGCASGGNLIPLACRYPDARFTGIDLSPRQIEDGRRDIAALGLGNVELREMNLMEVDAAFGEFDYIIAHGIYSWIPAAVRERLLAVCRANLSPPGVAYVSYNTHPGWGMRGVVRGMMRYHVAGIADPAQRAGEARGLLEFLRVSLDRHINSYTSLLREESQTLAKAADSYMFHEHLEDENHAFYLHEFAAQAAAAGLEYLCEEEFISAQPELMFTPEVAARVRQYAQDPIALEQYCDFLTRRAFRQSLLVGAGRKPRRDIAPGVIDDYYVASQSKPAAAGGTGAQRYTSILSVPFMVSDPLTKAALAILEQAWPQALHFPVLHAQACAALGKPPQDGAAALEADLLRAMSLRAVTLHREPLLALRQPSERPVAFAPARYYASRGNKLLPNTLHGTVRVDGAAHVLIPLLDGTRDREALIAAMVERVLDGRMNIIEKGARVTDPDRARVVMAKSVAESLELLAQGGFITG